MWTVSGESDCECISAELVLKLCLINASFVLIRVSVVRILVVAEHMFGTVSGKSFTNQLMETCFQPPPEMETVL